MSDDQADLPGPLFCALLIAGCIAGVGLVALLAWWANG